MNVVVIAFWIKGQLLEKVNLLLEGHVCSAIAKYWTSFDPLRAMFAGNKAFAELKGKWGMENGRWKRKKRNLFFISRERSSIIQTRMVREDVFCLTGGCQSRPGVFRLVQVSS